MNKGKAISLRNTIISASGSLTDNVAIQSFELFPLWKVGIRLYGMNDSPTGKPDRVQYNGKLYKVIQGHTTQSDWNPSIVPALFTEVVPEGVIPDWKQPTGAQDAYSIGDKVRFNGMIYQSLINGNVWSPTAYPAGWKLV